MCGTLSADGRDMLCSRIPADVPEAAAGFPKPQLFALRRLSPGGFPLQGFVSIRRLSRDAGVVVWRQRGEGRDGDVSALLYTRIGYRRVLWPYCAKLDADTIIVGMLRPYCTNSLQRLLLLISRPATSHQ